jgi:hypothetical protein
VGPTRCFPHYQFVVFLPQPANFISYPIPFPSNASEAWCTKSNKSCFITFSSSRAFYWYIILNFPCLIRPSPIFNSLLFKLVHRRRETWTGRGVSASVGPFGSERSEGVVSLSQWGPAAAEEIEKSDDTVWIDWVCGIWPHESWLMRDISHAPSLCKFFFLLKVLPAPLRGL